MDGFFVVHPRNHSRDWVYPGELQKTKMNCNLNFFSYMRIIYSAVTSYNLMHIPCLA